MAPNDRNRQSQTKLPCEQNMQSGEATDRVQADKELHEEEARYRLLVETTLDWIWEVDREGRYTYSSPQVEEILGYKPDEILGKTPFDLMPPDEAKAIEELFHRAVAEAAPVTKVRNVNNTKDGRLVVLETNGAPILSPEGQVIGYRGIDRDVTARVRAEEELKKSEKKYKNLFHNAMAGMTRTTFRDGTVLECNERAAEMLGYEGDVEAFKREYKFAEHYVTKGVRAGIIKKLMQVGEARNLEAELTKRDGSHIWIRWHARANVEEKYFDSVIIDVTEQKEALAKLQESERIFRRLFDQSPVAIAITSPDGKYIRVNKAMCQLLGYSAGELIGMSYTDISHPQEAEKDQAWRQSFFGKKAERYERDKRYVRKDGKVIWVRTSVRAVRNDDGRVQYFIPVMQDISDQKRAEHILESFTDGIVQSVPALIVTLDTEGRIQRFNQFAESVTGYSENEVLNKRWIDVLSPEQTRAKAKHRMRRMLAGYALNGEEGLIRAKNGREIPLRWYSAPLHDEEGNIRGIVGIAIDITDLRRKEEQLRQAAKMEAVGRLAGGVAHDFNNHLAAIKGYSELLLEELPNDDPAREDVLEITIAADHAAEVTRQLLAFGRKSIMRPRKINVNEVVGDTAKGLRRMLGEDISLTVREDPELWPIQADRNQIRQILMNIALNARDAMPEGGRLQIETENVFLDSEYAESHPEVARGPYVLLSIADTGKGMDQETLDHLFEPFYTTKQMGAGTGLGLSSVHGTVVQSGGHVTVESKPGEGTTFRIYLPRAEEESAKHPADAAPPECPGGHENILLVEDEGPVRRYLARTLRAVGYTVTDAGDPYEALKKLNELTEEVDLLITDVVMPGMNGAALAKEARKLQPSLPVLYISGYSQDIIFARRVFMDEPMLSKPFTAKQLCTLVRNKLDKEQATEEELTEKSR